MRPPVTATLEKPAPRPVAVKIFGGPPAGHDARSPVSGDTPSRRGPRPCGQLPAEATSAAGAGLAAAGLDVVPCAPTKVAAARVKAKHTVGTGRGAIMQASRDHTIIDSGSFRMVRRYAGGLVRAGSLVSALAVL